MSILMNDSAIDINTLYFLFTDPPNEHVTQQHANDFVTTLFGESGLGSELGSYNPEDHCSVWDLKAEYPPDHRFHINATIKKMNVYAGNQAVKMAKIDSKEKWNALKSKLDPFKQFMPASVLEAFMDDVKAVEEKSK